MKTALLLIVAALAVASVAARCPNGCSGHGNCGRDDKCACWANWQGNDCSLRTCGYDKAWALNKYDPHFYAECSNKGICDRSTGECDCFDCYEGRACTRSSCPNDCSGHGKCRYINEQSNSATYVGWDAAKIQVCVCDGGFYGPDCSQRYCPMGDDPMTICDDVDTADSRTDYDIQRITVTFRHIADSAQTMTPIDQAIVDADTDEFIIKFTDPHGEVWTTQRIEDAFAWDARDNTTQTKMYDETVGEADAAVLQAQLYVDAADRVRDALKSLPNKVIPDVNVQPATTAAQHNNTRVWDVSFTSPRNSGTQNALSCEVTGCQSAGCQPMYKQMRYVSHGVFALDSWTEITDGALTNDVSLTADTIFDAVSYTGGQASTARYDYKVMVEVSNNASFSEQDGRPSSEDLDSDQGYQYRAAVVKIGDGSLATADWKTYTSVVEEGGEDDIAATRATLFRKHYTAHFHSVGGDVSGAAKFELAHPHSRVPVEGDNVAVSNGVFLNFESRKPQPGYYMWLVSLATCSVDPDPAAYSAVHPNRENVECSNRGECDASSGTCACHEGYYGDNCQSQTILV